MSDPYPGMGPGRAGADEGVSVHCSAGAYPIRSVGPSSSRLKS